MASTKTVVFIHGMYMTPLCWEGWVERFRSKGYRCVTPAWPGRDQPVETLRKNQPDMQLGELTLAGILEHLAGAIKGLDEKPALIGHSMGGLAVQILLQQGLAVAGIAIDPAPPMGVFTAEWPFLKANWGHVNPLVPQNQPVEMSFERFQYAFANGMPLAEQQAAYEKYVVPESRRVPRQSLTSIARIDFKKPHAPLLLIAGSIDHLIPASLVRNNFNKYKNSSSVTDYREFSGRNHFLIGQEKWEEVADACLEWLSKQAV
ncbi:MAG: alpha/beta hydrolase [Anaerolineales bacterium]